VIFKGIGALFYLLREKENQLEYCGLSGVWNMPEVPEGGFSGSGRILPFQAIKLPGFI
jgi:hypothetical protein